MINEKIFKVVEKEKNMNQTEYLSGSPMSRIQGGHWNHSRYNMLNHFIS
jgi:hypothetical protein